MLCAWSIGIKKLILELNSLEAIRLIERASGNLMISSLVSHVLLLMQRDWDVMLVDMSQEDNHIAYGMSKIVRREDLLWHRFLSHEILFVLHSDLFT
ncbi:hypothetical protein V6N12_058849 [Hibiscus sabdariffa]|uniref:RNase H type-1 domain-containing protein n=1 Tax=Hibiscus sabdariffa TaxID=183260 RepID=A0ABR2ETC7_9ROSI